MLHVRSHNTVLLLAAVLSSSAVSSRGAAAQGLDDLAGYWISVESFGGATLTRFFEVTVSDRNLMIHSTALKFEAPNRPPEISDPDPDESYALMAEGAELTGRHDTASYRLRDCTVAATSEPVSGQIRENGQISLAVKTGHVQRDALPMACHVDYSDPATVTVSLTRRPQQ